MIAPIADASDAKWIFDVAGYPEKWPDDLPAFGDRHLILGVYATELVGCFPLNLRNDAIEIHACFHPHFRGKFAVQSAKEAFGWIWQNTFYNLIFAETEKPHVSRFAAQCGMKKSGNRYEVKRWADL